MGMVDARAIACAVVSSRYGDVTRALVSLPRTLQRALCCCPRDSTSEPPAAEAVRVLSCALDR